MSIRHRQGNPILEEIDVGQYVVKTNKRRRQ